VGKKTPGKNSSSVFKAGAVSLAFLIIGYQTALFVHRAAVLRIEAHRDRPDTVFVVGKELVPEVPGAADEDISSPEPVKVRKEAPHSASVTAVRNSTRQVESFKFNPNTVGMEELMRLGFSEKQAQSIVNYREGGGRFRRKEDFSRSFVVSDSVYRRLEAFIDIPLVDINRADSAAFDALPGIGGWFAARMVAYREQLGGYSYPEQLMDIYRFDREKYDGLSDLICCSPPVQAFGLWHLPEDELRRHPYIKSYQAAHSIVLYRENTPRGSWSVKELADLGILDPGSADKLGRCYLE